MNVHNRLKQLEKHQPSTRWVISARDGFLDITTGLIHDTMPEDGVPMMAVNVDARRL